MSTSTPQPAKAPRNKYAQSSVAFGVASLLLLQMSKGGVVLVALGLLASLLALATGVLGMRTAQALSRKGRNWAIAGLVIGGIGVLVSLVLFVA